MKGRAPVRIRHLPGQFFEPYLTRRRRCGFALYAAVGISKGDTDAMRAQHARKLTFFDAPVGLIFTLDRRVGAGSWVDCGMFLQNVSAGGPRTRPGYLFADGVDPLPAPSG